MVINRGLNKKEGLWVSSHCRAGLALQPSQGTVPESKQRWPRQGCQDEIAFSMGRTRRLRAIMPTVLTLSVAMVELQEAACH